MNTLILAVFLSIPFYYIWNELAPIYFYWLPDIYKQLPFWHCMGLLVLISILRLVAFPSNTVFNKQYIWGKKKKC